MICTACPRKCSAERSSRKLGFCRVPDDYVISRAAPHFWEEPCISGEKGSGTIFFTGCNLGCIFCQNADISRGGKGKTLSEDELIGEMHRLQDEGVHNINLVTPSHYAFRLAGTLKKAKLSVPVVWNSSGYDSVEALKALEALNVLQTLQGSGTYLNDPTFSFLEFPFSLKLKNGTNIHDLIVARETVE